jgi:hypothetical protein
MKLLGKYEKVHVDFFVTIMNHKLLFNDESGFVQALNKPVKDMH